jgi:two-component system, sporulation sensor kinase B
MQNEVTSLLFNHLFINVLVSLSLVFFYRYYFTYSGKRVVMVVLCTLSSIDCMLYPINVAPEYKFDLSQVPYILGSIMGGTWVSFFIGAGILLFRFYQGGSGVLYSVIVLSLMFSLLQGVRPLYWRLNDKCKLYVAMGLSLFSSTLIHVLTLFKRDMPLDLQNGLVFAATQCVTTAIVFYCMIRMRHQLRLQEEMNQVMKNRLVSQIAASMSHEVRNPLTVIRGFVQMIGDMKMSQDKLVVYKDLILSEIDRAVSIINDYLSLAKSEEEDVQRDLQIKQEMQYVLSVMEPYAALQGVELDINLNSPSRIRVHSYKLRQSLINLVKNAIEAMPQGGRLTVNVSDNRDKVLVIIRDTGVGMSREQLARIGTPFYSTKGTGTGLGMHMVNQMLQSSRGSMRISSEVGKGTSFVLEFPKIICDIDHEDTPESVIQSG